MHDLKYISSKYEIEKAHYLKNSVDLIKAESFAIKIWAMQNVAVFT